jgi:hypothetical protein
MTKFKIFDCEASIFCFTKIVKFVLSSAKKVLCLSVFVPLFSIKRLPPLPLFYLIKAGADCVERRSNAGAPPSSPTTELKAHPLVPLFFRGQGPLNLDIIATVS